MKDIFRQIRWMDSILVSNWHRSCIADVSKRDYINISFLWRNHTVIAQTTKIIRQMIAKPNCVDASGTHSVFTFMPYNPLIMVGIAKTMVTEVSSFIVLRAEC